MKENKAKGILYEEVNIKLITFCFPSNFTKKKKKTLKTHSLLGGNCTM